MSQVRDDASLGDLFSRLAEESSTLVRQEVQLAKAELRESAQQVGRSVASLLIGGAIAYAGLLAILAAIIVGLGQAGLPWWLAALVVGVVVAIIGYILIARARSGLQAANLVPDRTIKTLKEDREWAKEQIA
jgi:drug/metabolite transporter (DMT)-like permease